MHLGVSPTLLIAGAGHVGQALATLAVDLDFDVMVMDDPRGPDGPLPV
jgi:phosphoglycerate dehydrogenase-like enzyme